MAEVEITQAMSNVALDTLIPKRVSSLLPELHSILELASEATPKHCNDILQSLQQSLKLQEENGGIAFFGHTGHGKSTVLNAVLGCELLPTKLHFDRKKKSIDRAITSAVTEIRIVDEKDQPKFSLALSFVSPPDWIHIRKREYLDSFSKKAKANEKTETDSFFKQLYEGNSSPFGVSFNWPGWRESLEKENNNEMMADPIYRFLCGQQYYRRSFSNETNLCEYLMEVACGTSVMAVLISGVVISGSFPESKLSPGTVLFDVPGSGDIVFEREQQRLMALRRARRAVLVCGEQPNNQQTVDDIKDLVSHRLTQACLFVRTKRVDDVDLLEEIAQEGNKAVREWLLGGLKEHVERLFAAEGAPHPPREVIVIDRDVKRLNLDLYNEDISALRSFLAQDWDSSILGFMQQMISGFGRLIEAVTSTRTGDHTDDVTIFDSWSFTFLRFSEAVVAIFKDHYLALLPQVQNQLIHDYFNGGFESYWAWPRGWAHSGGYYDSRTRYVNTPACLANLFADVTLPFDMVQTWSDELWGTNNNLSYIEDVVRSFPGTLQTHLKGVFKDILQRIFHSQAKIHDPYVSKKKRIQRTKEYFPFLFNSIEKIERSWESRFAIVESSIRKSLNVVNDWVQSQLSRYIIFWQKHRQIQAAVQVGYTDQSVKLITSILQVVPQLQHILSLIGYEENYANVHLDLQADSKVLSISPSFSVPPSKIFELLSEAVSDTEKRNASALVLRFLNLDSSCVEQLKNILSKMNNLQVVDLSGNCFTQEDASKIATVLAKPVTKTTKSSAIPEEVLQATSLILNFTLLNAVISEKRGSVQLECKHLRRISSDLVEGRKVAIVISNANYAEPIPSLIIGGNQMAAFLEQNKFTVLRFEIGDLIVWNSMLKELEDLITSAPALETLFFFYTGHGALVRSTPVFQATDSSDCSFGDVYKILSNSKYSNPFVAVLDCCAVHIDVAIADTEAPKNFLLASSTLPGKIAIARGGDRPSPYVEAVLRTWTQKANIGFVDLIRESHKAFSQRFSSETASVYFTGRFPHNISFW